MAEAVHNPLLAATAEHLQQRHAHLVYYAGLQAEQQRGRAQLHTDRSLVLTGRLLSSAAAATAGVAPPPGAACAVDCSLEAGGAPSLAPVGTSGNGSGSTFGALKDASFLAAYLLAGVLQQQP